MGAGSWVDLSLGLAHTRLAVAAAAGLESIGFRV